MMRIIVLLFCLAGSVSALRAATIPSANCTRPAVQAAVALAAPNDTVTIPAGNCVWTSSVTVTHGITLKGAGQGVTNITLSATDWLVILPTDGTAMRVTGFSVTGPGVTNVIQFDNYPGGNPTFRLDHVTFTNVAARTVSVGTQSYAVTGALPTYGLIDHITYTTTGTAGFMLYYGVDNSWLTPDDYGSANALYIEDSTFTWPASACSEIIDTEHGGRPVIRHNSLTNGTIQSHDTGSTPQSRGLRKYEYYSNTLDYTPGFSCNSAIALRGGTGVIFSNAVKVTGGTQSGMCFTQIYRADQTGGSPWISQCDGSATRVCSNFRSHCRDGDHRPCGTGNECAGIGSGICDDTCTADSQCPASAVCLNRMDGNTGSGYVCRDQVAAGQDSGVQHAQSIDPIHLWLNTDSGSGNALITTSVSVAASNARYIQTNREFYDYKASFTGTAGTGSGLLSARPATCTPTVGYWATDTKTLFRCVSQNTWSSFYKALEYPHPLQSGTSTVAPPQNVRITTVQ